MTKRRLHLAVFLMSVWAANVATDSDVADVLQTSATTQPTTNPQREKSSPVIQGGYLQEWTLSTSVREAGGNMETNPQTTAKATSLVSRPVTMTTDDPRPSTTAINTSQDCEPLSFTLSDLEGELSWSGPLPDCGAPWSWLIHLPDDHGVTLTIHEVQVSGTHTIKLYSVSDESLPELLRDYFVHNDIPYYSAGFAPVLSYSNQLTIVLNASQDYVDTVEYGSCSFNISYYGHPLREMPERSRNYVGMRTGSSELFFCDHIPPNRLPRVLKCDKVRQCLGDEDEAGCDYRQEGCGDWIPHGDHCLKVDFIVRYSHQPGREHETMPLQAEEACQSMHQAKLAILPNKEDVRFVAGIIHQSGQLEAVVGLKKVKPLSKKLRHLYRYLWQWGERGSPVAYDQLQIQRDGPLLDCAVLDVRPPAQFRPLPCVLPRNLPDGYVCMKDNPNRTQVPSVSSDIYVPNTNFPRATRRPDRFPTKPCPDGSLVQTFHQCQWMGWRFSDGSVNDKRVTDLPMFQCRYGQPVHYTHVCDGNDDCPDRSDEMNCRPPRFAPLLEASFACRSSQVIPARFRCDSMADCFDESDEENCVACQRGVVCASLGCIPDEYLHFFDSCPVLSDHWYVPPLDVWPANVWLDGFGMSSLLSTSPFPYSCVEGLFQCANGLCIPTYLLNNGEKDCLLGEDENIPMENVTCPGFYRCHGYGNCVHRDYVCDGIYHCPNKDDERYCDLPCPENCTCEGYAFTCKQMFDPYRHLVARYLDLSGSTNPPLDDFHVMEFLQFLNLSTCYLRNVTLKDMPQLTVLDLSFNALKGLSSLSLEKLSGLSFLNLSGNPFVKLLDSAFSGFLRTAGLSSLKVLTMRNIELTAIANKAFEPLSALISLDVRENNIETFDKDVLWGLTDLNVLYADTHKLCCSYFHRTFSLSACHAPTDELSSCSDLLRHDFFRVFLWTFAALSLTGNAGVLIYRLLSQGQKSSGAFTVLVSNLCASDLLMGVYMMMTGSADEYYRGVYVSKEAEWRGSAVCKVAGFLAFLSSEVSAFVICLVTLDRFVVLCFPLKKNVHMNVRSALTACAIAWGVGVMLAAVPLIAQWEFYGQNGICLPLPITRREFPGKEYAYGVFIVLNFVLFLFIGVGQALIFRSIRRAGSQAGTKRRQQEADIARRLFLVVLTDFLCWFPIGLMGLLAYRGTPIAGVVNVWAAIFVLPLNSAINPFVYTLNSMVQRWQQQRLEKRTKRALGRLQAEIPKWSNSSIEELMRICLRTKAVKKERILQWLGFKENVERDLSDRVETAERDQELEQEGPDENRSFDGASARMEPPTDDNLFTVCSTFKTG